MSGDHDDLVETLERVAEAIDDRSLQVLREAVSQGATRRPDSDRHLTQARRAVDKAIQALRRASGDEGEPSTDD